MKRYEAEHGANESTYWLIFELLWRDFFQFTAARHGASFFQRGGIAHKPWRGEQDAERFEAWCQGRTGQPFIDANMRELAATGWMSNRGRQNVASYLVNDLLLDWRMGAFWFERMLIDYDPCSNWGNWLYLAGSAMIRAKAVASIPCDKRGCMMRMVRMCGIGRCRCARHAGQATVAVFPYLPSLDIGTSTSPLQRADRAPDHPGLTGARMPWPGASC